MRKILLIAVPLLMLASCVTDEEAVTGQNEISYDSEIVTLPNGVKLEMIEGMYIYQGDIILTQEQVDILGSEQTRGYVVYPYVKTWPNRIVYYTLDSQMPADKISLFAQAKTIWESSTDIRFVQRTDQPDYAEFAFTYAYIPPASHLGRITGKQSVYISNFSTLKDVLSLIGHTVGLMNEHTRPDRDQYITVNAANAMTQPPFGIDPSGIVYREFDFNSIMLWDSYKYTMNGLPTITDKNGNTYTVNQDHLSEGDIKSVAFLYNNYSEDIKLTLTPQSPYNTGQTVNISASYYSSTCTAPEFQYKITNTATNAVVYTSAITSGSISYTFQSAGVFSIRATVTNESPQVWTEVTVIVRDRSTKPNITIDNGSTIYATESKTIRFSYLDLSFPNPQFSYEITPPSACHHGTVTTGTGSSVYYKFCCPGYYKIRVTVTNVTPQATAEISVYVKAFEGQMYFKVASAFSYGNTTESVYNNTITGYMNSSYTTLPCCMPLGAKVHLRLYTETTSYQTGDPWGPIVDPNPGETGPIIGPIGDPVLTFENVYVNILPGRSPVVNLPQTHTTKVGNTVTRTYYQFVSWVSDPTLVPQPFDPWTPVEL